MKDHPSCEDVLESVHAIAIEAEHKIVDKEEEDGICTSDQDPEGKSKDLISWRFANTFKICFFVFNYTLL